MALESILEADGGSGGGGLVIWLHYPTLYNTAEWFLDYYHDVWSMDTAQSDMIDDLFVHKKGWKGAGAEQYKLLYDTFLEQKYRLFFENTLCNMKGITVDAVVGAGKLINQCDDFYLSLESDDYEPEIRMGHSCDSSGILKYDRYYKYAIINHCDAANTATEEEDSLLDEAIDAVADLNYPHFAASINYVKDKKDVFIKKQKRILNYKNTFSDYTQRTESYDQELADAYNALVDEEVAGNNEYTPIAVVPPWEVDCATIWTESGNTDAMIDFINDAPEDATLWSAGTAEAMAIIYNHAYEYDAEVMEAFDARFQKITHQETIKPEYVTVFDTTGFNGVKLVTYDNYTYETDPAVVKAMEPYMDKYLNGEAWTALTDKVEVSVKRSGLEKEEADISVSVTRDEKGRPVTTVSVTDADGNVLGRKSVSEHNVWDEKFEPGFLKEKRLNGETDNQIDAYVKSDQGVLDNYTNPYYKLSDEEEKDAQERINDFWDEHQDMNGIRENGGLEDEFADLKSKVKNEEGYEYGRNLTWEEYLKLNGFDDIDEYNLAVQYYKLEQKLSDSEAYWNGVTDVPYNIGKATDSVLDKIASGCQYSGYDEYDLEIMALCEEQEKERDLARQASKLQNPYAYGAGKASYMLVTSAVAGEMLSGTGLVDKAASLFGGGAIAEKTAEVVLDTAIVDIPTDTVPEMIVNYNNGMSTDDIWKNAAINVAVNAGINLGADVVLPGVLGQVAKSFDDADDVFKSSDGLKLAEDVDDTGKAIPDVTATGKNSDIGSDASKMADNKAVVDTASDGSKTSDLGKSADNVTDSSKMLGKTTDDNKIASNVAESEKAIGNAADTTKIASNTSGSVKGAENVVESGKTVERVTESGKTIEHVAEAEKKIDNVSDATKSADDRKTVDNVAEAEKTVDHSRDATKTSDAGDVIDQASDAEKSTDHFTDASKVDDQGADSAKTADNEHDIIVARYRDFGKGGKYEGLPGEAHHTFQDAAFCDVVDKKEAYCIKLDGDVRISGTAHNKFHDYMENWWDQFRQGGSRFEDMPTIQEYAEAAEDAYIYAGLDPGDAHYVVECSKEQYAEWYVFKKIEDEYGEAVQGFSKEERDRVLSYIDNSIKGGDLDSFNEPISQWIAQDKTNDIFSRVDEIINNQGTDYIDYVISNRFVKKIPGPLNLLVR